MRARRLLSALVASALSLTLGLVACDIFHSTDNLPTLCTTNPSAPGCTDASADSGGDGAAPSPFGTDSAAARERAKQTCAWLAACETPMGDNLTGRCVANAILAFDESTNPNRKVKGDARAYWQCLYGAALSKSCAQIKACTFGGPPAACGGTGFVGCAGKQTRVVCSQKGVPPPTEPCIGLGRTCAALDPGTGQHDAICAGPQGQYCMTSGCSGSKLSACNDAGVDLGQDCAYVGSGACYADAGACVPEGSGACAQTNAITCDDAGVAHGCASGVPERVDCNALSGGSCVANPSAPGWLAPSSACVQTSGCSVDNCMGTSLKACVRGKFEPIDCTAIGLGGCTTVTTPDGTFATCGAP